MPPLVVRVWTFIGVVVREFLSVFVCVRMGAVLKDRLVRVLRRTSNPVSVSVSVSVSVCVIVCV